MGSMSEGEGYLPLFETKEGKGKNAYRLFSISMFLGISMIWVYRITHVPVKIEERWVWIFMFLAELWFGLYWVLTQSVRWNRVYRYTFRDRLSHRTVFCPRAVTQHAHLLAETGKSHIDLGL
ncbi:hypothetical protein IFM89_030133 [Coptis chinensis]|uniref:Uncharacterized protein n=1 Tax=Coptis chinensis TaxID=261450 RepID=A0A835I6I9_9MAGN|nr:hypothetical protein IFM89_030133 [Coptis chinensis]